MNISVKLTIIDFLGFYLTTTNIIISHEHFSKLTINYRCSRIFSLKEPLLLIFITNPLKDIHGNFGLLQMDMISYN